MLLSCYGLKKNYGDRPILKDIAFDIENGERIGLVGRNGAGKSTLVKILTGQLEPDAGKITTSRRGFATGYLAQADDKLLQVTAFDMDDVNRSFRRMSSQLGIGHLPGRENVEPAILSGGEKIKTELARIWSLAPHLLVLDEPTSSLDFRGVEWLIDELHNYPGAVLVVSHDRYFLDQTVDRILELDHGMIKPYKGNYSYYRQEKTRQYESQLHQYESEEKTRRTIQSNIEQQKEWAAKAHRDSTRKSIETGNRMGVKEYYRAKAKKRDQAVKSKIKRLEKLKTDGVEKPRAESRVFFRFDEVGKSGRTFLEAEGISKSFGERILFEESSFFIRRGEKIGLIGDNGTGKTTFLKMILGQEYPDSGSIFLSSSARIAYVRQDQAHLNQEESVLIYLKDLGLMHGSTGTLLANLGFARETLERPIFTLSPGEKTKLQIAVAILRDNDVLLLDEPGNYLDLFGREQLEKSLEAYDGTVVLVSHDRYMLERICGTLLVIADGKIRRLEGGFKEYLDRRETSKLPGTDTGERRLRLENRMTYLLGELGRLKPESPEYQDADTEYRNIVLEMRTLDRVSR